MIPLFDTIPSRNPPLVTYGLIALNALVFFVEVQLPADRLEGLFYLFGVVPARFTDPEVRDLFPVDHPAQNLWPLLTTMFLHGGWLHLIGNMWTLWIFGDNVEDRMGPWRYLGFYLLGGLAASAVHILSDPDSIMPAVGASGAIAAVLGAYMVMYPESRVVILVPILFIPLFFAVPAVFYLLIWIGTQVLSGTLALAAPTQVNESVAWWAHIGGFLFGVLAHRLFLRHPYRQRPRRLMYRDVSAREYPWSRLR